MDMASIFRQVLLDNSGQTSSVWKLREEFASRVAGKVEELLKPANIEKIDINVLFDEAADAMRAIRLKDGKLVWYAAALDIPEMLERAGLHDPAPLENTALSGETTTFEAEGKSFTVSPLETETRKIEPNLKQKLSRFFMGATLATAICLAPAFATAHPNRVFGTVEFGRNPGEHYKIGMEVLKLGISDPVFAKDTKLGKKLTWESFAHIIESKSSLSEKLDLVNNFWNSTAYVDDDVNWQMDDHWATPSQFLKRGGDCEDYAIAKYLTLRKLGIPADDMRLLMVIEKKRNLPHALLAVNDGEKTWILDNIDQELKLEDEVRENYEIKMSLNENRAWTHVTPKKNLVVENEEIRPAVTGKSTKKQAPPPAQISAGQSLKRLPIGVTRKCD